MSTERALRLPPVTLSEHQGVRYLHLGTPWVQGALRIAQPERVELVYVQRMLAALLWLPTERLQPGPGRPGARAVQLGLGAATLTRFTLLSLGLQTTVVEINPQVVSACRALFHLPVRHPRLTVEEEDAGFWVAQASRGERRGTVDLLHVDLYDQDAAGPVLDDEPFYTRCRDLLAPGGVMAVNLFGRSASFHQSVARIAGVFGRDQVWQLRPTREGNTVVVAGRSVVVPDRTGLEQRAQALESRFGAQGLPARAWLRMVQPYRSPST